MEKWSGREDSNLRPPRPERGALPGCATLRRSLEAGLYRLHARAARAESALSCPLGAGPPLAPAWP